MKDLYEKEGIIIDDTTYLKLQEFKKILLYYNEKFNITAITDSKDIEIKHFIDSIKGERYFKNNSKIIEIGSGGGFPSIPLIIYRNDLTVLGIESIGKKCIFLETVKKELDLKNFEVLNERCEILAKDKKYREKFDHATARAVAKLNTLSEYCLPFVKVNGTFIAYKGQASTEIDEAKNAIKVLGGKISNIKEYKLTNEEFERTLIEIKKIENCLPKYPRGQGKERSNPL